MQEKLELPPGPKNPVGVVWIALSAKGRPARPTRKPSASEPLTAASVSPTGMRWSLLSTSVRVRGSQSKWVRATTAEPDGRNSAKDVHASLNFVRGVRLAVPGIVKDCLGLVLRLCGRRRRRLSSCARAGASRGGTLFFGVKTWRQDEVQQKARRCCAEDDRQEAPTLIVGFDFFWALPICRRKAVPLIIPVHTLSRQNLLLEKNLCSFLVVPLLTRHFEKRG